MSYNFGSIYRQNVMYVVVKKRDIYLAVLDARNDIYNGYIHEQYQDLINQGFIYWYTIFAENSKSAIEQVKEIDDQELNKLRDRIRELEAEKNSRTDMANLDPYEVLGFEGKVRPSMEKIKERKRKLSKACHPDTGGSQFLMKLINNACKKLGA